MSKAKFSFKEALGEIKKLVSGFSITPAAGDNNTTDNLKDYTTDSGVAIKIDKLEVGGKVYGEDGTTPITTSVILSDGTTIDVDDQGVITKVTVPNTDSSTIDTTAPDVLMNAASAKFATGTPEERIANLESMSLAMMQYCYGWKIDEVTRKQLEDQAISVYKTIAPPEQFTAKFNEQKAAFESTVTKQQAAFDKVLELLEKFSLEPDGDPAEGVALPGESKKERAANLIAETRKAKAGK